MVEQVRLESGRNAQPSLAICDSAERQTGQKRGALEVGFDGNKQVKGRKRHIIVDVLGLVLGCFVTAANVADIKAAPVVWVWALERFSQISKILGDKGYRSKAATDELERSYGCELEISLRHEQGWEVEPKRWIVERTLAWLDNARALGRDYEGLPENHEGMVYVTMIRLMLRRLCRNRRTRSLTKQQKRELDMLN